MDSGAVFAALRTAAHSLDGDPREALAALQAASNVIDAAKAALVVKMEREAVFEVDGASTVVVWARTKLGIEAATTHALRAADQTLTLLPEVAEAAKAGRIGLGHVRIFTYGIRHIGLDHVREHLPWLLRVAGAGDAVDLRRVMRGLKEAVHPEELDDAWERGMDKADLQINQVPDGWHVTGFLPIDTGARFKTVLDTLAAPKDADDPRTGAERRVDALDGLCQRVLNHGLPTDKGLRSHLSVVLDTTTAATGELQAPKPWATLARFGSIGPKLLEYLGCDADLTGILANGPLPQAQILNVGRTKRFATTQQRLAIAAKQGGQCATPGCHHTHLEIHHHTRWADGGLTDLDAMVGLCTRCHHHVHRHADRVFAPPPIRPRTPRIAPRPLARTG